MATQRPRRLLAHSEVLRSCCGVKLRVPNTCVFARDFDFPGGDAQRCSARDCTKASWRNPIAQENRTSVAGYVMLPLKFVARVFQATAPRCFPAASSASLFAVVVECRVRHPLNSAQLPSRHAGNRRRPKGQSGNSCPALCLRPNRILHSLSLAKQIRDAAEIGRLKWAALCLDPKRLHDEV